MAELGVGTNAPDEVNVVIENQRGQHNKIEMDKETGYLTLDRVTPVAMGYPTDYGYIPGTLCDDGDAVDVLLVIDEPMPHGVVVPCRPVGVLNMVDSGEKDEKVVCVAVNDVSKADIKTLDDLGENFKRVNEHYYSHYKDWKNDWKGAEVKLNGWGDAAAARQIIQASIDRAEN